LRAASRSSKRKKAEVNFSSFDGAKYGRVDPRTFNLGSTAVHELYHASTGKQDLKNGVFSHSFDWTGPVVDFVNQIRAERGLPLRATYNAQPTIFGIAQGWASQHVNPKKPDKIYYVVRKRTD
jgi:hypothetical protein